MEKINLCFWLQSLFEVAFLKELSAEQVQIIRHHLNLTLTYDPEGGDFVHWLQGALEGQEEGLDERKTAVLAERLSRVFIHVIDPLYSDDPEVKKQLQDVHDGVEAPKEKKPAKAESRRRNPPHRPHRGHGRERRYMC